MTNRARSGRHGKRFERPHEQTNLQQSLRWTVRTWHDLIGHPTYADAILDSLVHNAYRLELEGPRSMREAGANGDVQAASALAPGCAEWQISERSTEMSVLFCVPPAPWVHRLLSRAPLRLTRGGHSAAHAGPCY